MACFFLVAGHSRDNGSSFSSSSELSSLSSSLSELLSSEVSLSEEGCRSWGEKEPVCFNTICCTAFIYHGLALVMFVTRLRAVTTHISLLWTNSRHSPSQCLCIMLTSLHLLTITNFYMGFWLKWNIDCLSLRNLLIRTGKLHLLKGWIWETKQKCVLVNTGQVATCIFPYAGVLL